ncbi:TetR family transcriptional regulator [Microbacterium sp. M3]|uniref:TetR family transcriptional regulator n=1 Tax=Microbacterium arthrosphaerae TaxID=792652 RepID=A0ABU4H295_9MICO|nr:MULTISPECIES: TetR family transcriptional regulator [Microbacterium]MDW4573446.1 TetR family transcriptional regulator [Microbacterium arthrosphaerae]MDW7607301.1 TetR family transcriptional regulator [Microbacterium sp. M3]
MSSSEGATTKSARTRALIRDAALRSFRERGYDQTTVRLIAQETGVSVGTTNYHFASKNDLVQELYLDVQQAHRDAALPLLADSRDLVDRLGIVFRTGIAQLEPYHPFAPEFLSAAVSPRSSINPLAGESAESREIVVGLFRDAVAGADDRLPAEFDADLPDALMLAHLLLALFWVYDSSPGRQRTQRLLDRGLRLLKLSLPLVRMRVLRRPLRELLDLVAEVRA